MSLSFSIQKKNEPNKKRKIAVMGFDDEEPDQKKSKQEIEEDQKAQSEALKNQGNALAEQDKYDEAIEKWNGALELTPDNHVLHELKAQVLMLQDKNFQAIQWATKSTELNPSYVDGWITLARAQLNFGEIELAVDSFSKAFKLSLDNDEVKNELDDAIKLMQKKKSLENTTGVDVIRGVIMDNKTMRPLNK
jgi:tetratricopeptide (TPR) repeat protein